MRPRFISLLTGLIAVAVFGVGGYQLGLQRSAHRADSASTSSTTRAQDTAASKDERRVLYWHDPMVPGRRFDKPGKSPFMDMDLVPVYADEASDDAGVQINPRIQQSLGVRTAPVTKANLSAPLNAVGNVAYDERNVAVVTARNAGYVEKLFVHTTLQEVRRGQPLAQLYIPEWVAAQEEYLSARRLTDPRLKGLEEAARQRMALTGMPESVIRRVESSLSVHPRVTVTAPITGVVTEISVRDGATLAMGSPMYRINGLQSVWVDAEIPEGAAQRVQPGTPAKAVAPAYPDQTFAGQVSTILPEVNQTTRTIKARLELRNPKGKLVPGMFVNVSFPPAGKQESLVVPTEAVIRTGTRTLVFVSNGADRFAPVEVEPGMEANGQTEIRRGLDLGQHVVVSGQFLVDSEASLRGAQARMQAGADDGKAPSAEATDGPQIYHAEGIVEEIDASEVMLSHEPIPALDWPAMTMGFQVPPRGLPEGVRVGDKVRFSFSKSEQDDYVLETVAPAAAPDEEGHR